MNLSELLSELPTQQNAAVIDGWEVQPQLGHFYDSLMQVPPKRTFAILALAPRRVTTRTAHQLPLIAIARFRTEYSIIQSVARSIAPAILITGVVPIIEPIRSVETETAFEDSEFMQRILKQGIHIWSLSNAK